MSGGFLRICVFCCLAARAETLFTIRGHLQKAAPDMSTASVMVRLLPRLSGPAPGPGGSAMAAPDGSFELRNIPSGAYYLTALRTRGRVETIGRIAVEVAGADLKDVSLPVTDPVAVSGNVRVEGLPRVDLGGGKVILRPAADLATFLHEAALNSAGRFTIDSVLPGEYSISFSGLPGTAYPKSVVIARAPAEVNLVILLRFP